MKLARLDPLFRHSYVLDGETLIHKQAEKLDQIDLIELWSSVQLLRKSRLRRQHLNPDSDTSLTSTY